jgi:transposase-like protein
VKTDRADARSLAEMLQTGWYTNGVSRKTLKGEDGLLEIAVPRAREGSFEPRLVAKGQTRLDDKIIARLSARDERARHPGAFRGALRA